MVSVDRRSGAIAMTVVEADVDEAVYPAKTGPYSATAELTEDDAEKLAHRSPSRRRQEVPG